jgi:Mor family transcriptional regulator
MKKKLPTTILPKNNNYSHDKMKSLVSRKKFSLNKNEENELRQIIEIVIEEFQDHFGQALNLSIKQMTQHLLSNINLFYNHYQQEFEQLTKKYRLAFLERFIQLMNKFQICQTKTTNIIQKTKPSISTRVIRFYKVFQLKVSKKFFSVYSWITIRSLNGLRATDLFGILL